MKFRGFWSILEAPTISSSLINSKKIETNEKKLVWLVGPLIGFNGTRTLTIGSIFLYASLGELPRLVVLNIECHHGH